MYIYAYIGGFYETTKTNFYRAIVAAYYTKLFFRARDSVSELKQNTSVKISHLTNMKKY